MAELKLIKSDLLPEYMKAVSATMQAAFDALQDAELSTDTFSFYTSVSSVFSSKIEGEEVDLDSYIKHKKFGIPFQPDYTRKTDDLYNAYIFAQKNPLNETNIREAHKLLSKHIVTEAYQGKYRTQNMFVTTGDGRIEYVAAMPGEVESEMQDFIADLRILLHEPMPVETVFYYAAMIHLAFVKIHPWNDGNGRSARLLEKWFLAEKLGAKAWFIQSEKHYYHHLQNYYKNIRLLGLEYHQLDYTKALPFLLMLPESLR